MRQLGSGPPSGVSGGERARTRPRWTPGTSAWGQGARCASGETLPSASGHSSAPGALTPLRPRRVRNRLPPWTCPAPATPAADVSCVPGAVEHSETPRTHALVRRGEWEPHDKRARDLPTRRSTPATTVAERRTALVALTGTHHRKRAAGFPRRHPCGRPRWRDGSGSWHAWGGSRPYRIVLPCYERDRVAGARPALPGRSASYEHGCT